MSRYGRVHDGNFPIAGRPPVSGSEPPPHVVPPLVGETYEQQAGKNAVSAAVAGAGQVSPAVWIIAGGALLWTASQMFAKRQ
jgi:hypothetical protein